MDQWQVFVNAVRGFQFHKKRGNSLAIDLSGTAVNGDCVLSSTGYSRIHVKVNFDLEQPRGPNPCTV